MSNPTPGLSKALRELRQKLGWSLDRVAQQTGVSKAMLGQIERGESCPTVATLWKVATGFGVPMTALLEPEWTAGEIVMFRNVTELRVKASPDGMQRSLLFPYEARFGFEVYELVFAPGYESISEPHELGVVEFITILEGTMELMIDGEWMPLAKGQSLRFPADRHHGYRNQSGTNVLLQDIIHYPTPPRSNLR
jgi:XRE family transcriptional regulator, regulator of sulfur utilization